MGLFTQLDAAAAQEVATAFSLGRIAAVAGIPQGTVNSNYRLTTERGTFFARINEGKAEEAVAFEARLLLHLVARGVPTPAPVRCTATGLGYASLSVGWVTVFPWLGGGHRARAQRSGADLHALGGALAGLHLAGDGGPPLAESRYRFDSLTTLLGRIAPAMDAAGLPGRDALERAYAELARTRARAAGLPSGLIHGDLFPDNVLFGEGPGELVALLDFEQASRGIWAYDLAVRLASWCFGETYAAAEAQALVAGYQAARRLEDAEWDGLYEESRLVAARFALTRLRDVALNPDASEWVRAHKDYRRYLARLAALGAMGAGGFARMVGRG